MASQILRFYTKCRFLNFLLLFLLWQVSMTTSRTVEQCDNYMELVIILDSSESIAENDPEDQPLYYWQLMKSFAINVIDAMMDKGPRMRVAILQYASDVIHVVDFEVTHNSQYLDEILRPLDHIGGNTNTFKAFRDAKDLLRSFKVRPNARKVILLLTDGLSNVEEVMGIVTSIKQNGFEIYSVGVSEYIDANELVAISSEPTEKHFFLLNSHEVLELAVSKTVYGLCVPDQPVCTGDVILDLVLLLDNSGSILETSTSEYDNYQGLKNFTISLLDLIDIGPDLTRVAALRFSGYIEIEFYLDSFLDDREAMKRAINNMDYEGSVTNIADGLGTARGELFSQRHGDRPGVRNVILLITDGFSNEHANRTIPEADMTKNENITVFVVGVTDLISEEELTAIASKPVGQHYFSSIDFKNLPTLKDHLISEVCKKDPVPTTPASGDSREASDEDDISDGVRKTPKGTAAKGSLVSGPLLIFLLTFWACQMYNEQPTFLYSVC